jgi:hypothetical protein
LFTQLACTIFLLPKLACLFSLLEQSLLSLPVQHHLTLHPLELFLALLFFVPAALFALDALTMLKLCTHGFCTFGLCTLA